MVVMVVTGVIGVFSVVGVFVVSVTARGRGWESEGVRADEGAPEATVGLENAVLGRRGRSFLKEREREREGDRKGRKEWGAKGREEGENRELYSICSITSKAESS